ncbi:MAG: cytochrome P450 [Lachnospiraceae bacterium]|jgi:fatty-acid peroxygenase|nr:cytochrome P450 [Lachnospiraceae bacterium]
MKKNNQIKCMKYLESSPMLLWEGYKFIGNQGRKSGTDIIETRIMGKKATCIRGPEAAEVFYDERFFERKDAMPKRVQKTLTGENGVQGLDGVEHRQRKMMFLSIMNPTNMELLKKILLKQWEISSRRWEQKEQIILFDEVQELLCKVACKWAGVPLKKSEVKLRADDLGKMIDGFGAIGPRYWEGRCARKRTEAWIRNIIEQIRSYKLRPRIGSAAYTIAWQYNLTGGLLDLQIATVELINIIRPIAAIATYVTFGAHAMYKHPVCRKKLKLRDERYTDMFVQEVRRYYPFTPFVGALVKESFFWKNHLFKKGTLVLLDVYGIDHDPRIWDWPNAFYPERFSDHMEGPYEFIPQGGGNASKGHRCAGEMVTVEVMKESFLYLAGKIDYKVPRQNMKYSLRRIPTLPKSRFVISHVRRK